MSKPDLESARVARNANVVRITILKARQRGEIMGSYVMAGVGALGHVGGAKIFEAGFPVAGAAVEGLACAADAGAIYFGFHARIYTPHIRRLRALEADIHHNPEKGRGISWQERRRRVKNRLRR